MFAFAGLAPIGGLFAGWLMEVGGTELALSLGGSLSLVVVAYAWAKNSGVEFRRRPGVPVFSVEEEEASRAA